MLLSQLLVPLGVPCLVGDILPVASFLLLSMFSSFSMVLYVSAAHSNFTAE